MISDEERNAEIKLNAWCSKKIDEGVKRLDDLPLQDRITYHNLIMKYELFSMRDDERRKITMLRRAGELIELVSKNIVLRYCT